MPNQSQVIQECTGDSRCPRLLLSKGNTVLCDFFDEELPPAWHAPKFFISLGIFKMCCFLFTWRGDLRWLHSLLREGDNWEQLHGHYLTQLNQLSTVQGLVLATAAVFMSSNPPLMQDVNYSSNASYACLAESLVFSLFGLLFQLKVSANGFIFRKREAAKVIVERRWRIFWHILGLAVPVILFGISVVLMIAAIVLTGFSSHSKTVQLYLSTTFAFLCACHLVSILASPLYYHLSNLCVHILKTASGQEGGASAA
ncbi:uncharacterized protein EDB91DRAFT_1170218 [Suillus paluster]|uniref:uncharacterized protein n=1 Tax=Suillus paluster TaxID=48578 RepID=UPI001B86A87A|nr:uncharacterized protein EDB91DRAFT_1170218 [Suillus paluster]KAG1724696.1 hypothetical protein EDB91DRAFT_1170218 [Suillus paluster]